MGKIMGVMLVCVLVLLEFNEVFSIKRKNNKYFKTRWRTRRNAEYLGFNSSSIDSASFNESHQYALTKIQDNCKTISENNIEFEVECEKKTDFCKIHLDKFQDYKDQLKLKICRCCLDDSSKPKSQLNNEILNQLTNFDITTKLLTCITEIYTNHLTNSNIVYFHKDTNVPYLNFPFPVTISIPDVPSLTFNKIDSYILVLPATNYKEELERIIALPNWSPRAKILLICPANLNSLFKFLIHYYIFNIILLSVEETIKVYTNFPFVEENVNRPVINPVVLNASDLFPRKLPRFWRNSTLVVSHVFLYPYVICALCGTGTDIDLTRLLAERLKFSVVFDETVYENWGGKLPNGTYDGAIDCLRSRYSDFVIGYFHLRDPVHMIDFEYTFSYMQDDVLWSIPRSDPLSHWANLIHIFKTTSWILILSALFFLSLSWLFFGKISKSEIPYFKSNHVLELPLKLILLTSIESLPKTFKLRLLYVTTWLFCFLVATIWNSHLIFYLTHDTYITSIRTTEELLESNLLLGIHSELAQLHLASGSEIGKLVYETYYACDAGFSCMDRSSADKDMATITSRRIFKYVLPSKYKVNGKNSLYLLDETIVKDYVVIYLQKGHPLFEDINRLLILICSAGFVKRIDDMQDFTNELLHRSHFSDAELFHVKALGLGQMQGTFYLLVFGLGVSGFVLIVEICVSRMSTEGSRKTQRLKRNAKGLMDLNILKNA